MKALTILAMAGAVIVVAIVVIVAFVNWDSIGNSGISLNGWIALVLGVLATLALGGGLMALVFISSRRGYDDTAGDDR